MGLVFIGDLERYRTGLEDVRSRQYRRLLEQADRYGTMQLQAEHPRESTTYMGIAIVNLALAYRLSGEEKYLCEARRFMQTVLGWEKWGNAHLVNVDLSASWILFGLSLGYDWLKDFLSPEERAAVSAKLRHHARIIYDYRRETWGRGWSTNFYQNHNWINMTGLAAAGYALMNEEPMAGDYTREAKENFARVFSYMAEDGSNYEGVTYWRYGGMWLFVYAHLLKVQEGFDYFRCSGYLQNTFYYRLYQACGDMKQQLNYGDCHDRYSGHTACVYYKTAAEYANGYAQMLGDMVTGEFLMEEAANSKVKPGILPEAAFEFLWYEPSVEAKAFDDLPLHRYFGDLGLLAVRSSWARDARVLTIKCAAPGGDKQWAEGWKALGEENIDMLSLSHHHPDNLSYIFARGGEYLTCEDGYNRNLMPDNHSVLLVDGKYTDAADVNDAYMASARLRMAQEGEAFRPEEYRGRVTGVKAEGTLVLYRGDNSGVHPREQEMQEVSRLLLTDGLDFWIFADVFRSRKEHIYTLQCNTDMTALPQQEGWRYPMRSGDVTYRVFSDGPVQSRQYSQQVISIMTSQEPDKLCRTEIQSLATSGRQAVKAQRFVECFALDEEIQACLEGDVFTLTHGGRRYELRFGDVDEATGLTAIEATVTADGRTTVYRM